MGLTRNEWIKAVKTRADGECEECGRETDNIHAHHANRDEHDNTLENGIGLCGTCWKWALNS